MQRSPRPQITDKQDFTDFFAHDACLPFGSTCPPDSIGPASGPLPQVLSVQLFLHAVVADIAGPDRETPKFASRIRYLFMTSNIGVQPVPDLCCP